MRIAQRFNAGYGGGHGDESPVGTTDFQSYRWDCSMPLDQRPALKRWAIFNPSLRDAKKNDRLTQ